MKSLFEPFFVHFRNPNFEGISRNKEDDLFDESGRRKNVPYIWPIGFLEWLEDTKERKKTTQILKNSVMKKETNAEVIRQCHIGYQIWEHYKLCKSNIIRMGPFWLPLKIPSGKNMASLYYAIRRMMLLKDFRKAAQASVRQETHNAKTVKDLPDDEKVGTKRPKKLTPLDQGIPTSAAAVGEQKEKEERLSTIMSKKIAAFEKDKYSQFPTYWLAFFFFGPPADTPLSSFVAQTTASYVKLEIGNRALSRTASRELSKLHAGAASVFSPTHFKEVMDKATNSDGTAKAINLSPDLKNNPLRVVHEFHKMESVALPLPDPIAEEMEVVEYEIKSIKELIESYMVFKDGRFTSEVESLQLELIEAGTKKRNLTKKRSVKFEAPVKVFEV